MESESSGSGSKMANDHVRRSGRCGMVILVILVILVITMITMIEIARYVVVAGDWIRLVRLVSWNFRVGARVGENWVRHKVMRIIVVCFPMMQRGRGQICRGGEFYISRRQSLLGTVPKLCKCRYFGL